MGNGDISFPGGLTLGAGPPSPEHLLQCGVGEPSADSFRPGLIVGGKPASAAE